LLFGCGLPPVQWTDDDDTSGDDDDDSAADDDDDDDSVPSLGLSLDLPDGDCVDLSLTDRGSYAVRFLMTGTPGTTVEVWSDKTDCGIDPFLYQEILLDDDGVGFFDLSHGGNDSCYDALLGEWHIWLEDDVGETGPLDLVFSNPACEEAADCDAASGFCPQDEPQPPFIKAADLFVLTAAERDVFTPPPDWLVWGSGMESWPLQKLWEAFDEGRAPIPLDWDAGGSGWTEPDGNGSQNHSLLWLGEAALGEALAGDVGRYELAAQRCLAVLALDVLQGHMRHEAVGQYAGFWQGGIATMALAGLYAPQGALYGDELLAAAQGWWADHIAVLRLLSVADGQVALIGARLPGEAGTEDDWMSLSAAVNLQLIDPRPYADLHSNISALLTEDMQPAPGVGGVPVKWHRPRHVAERWVVLRAVQTGALPAVPADHPVPEILQSIYRWTEGDRIHTALPASTGYRPARWQVSWEPGTVLLIEVGDPYGTPHTGKGPHTPPDPMTIPSAAVLLMGAGN
jgi:hypothetical protein